MSGLRIFYGWVALMTWLAILLVIAHYVLPFGFAAWMMSFCAWFFGSIAVVIYLLARSG